MADDYKEKLKNFIADIPAYPGQILAGDPHKPPYDDAFKKKLADPTFKLPTNDLFLKYTGAEHLDLIKNWATGGQRTTCNEFVGKCGAVMGAKDFLGQFDLEELLIKVGKGHAYVRATSGGPKPGYGDIFRPTHFHMGVSLGFRGDTWLTVESGQGGPNSTGADAIKRKEQPYDPTHILGWCDMRVYLDPRPPLPDWLIGTWVIYCGSKTYTYNINQYHEATTYLWKPIGDSNNVIPTDSGTVSLQGSDTINITWTMEGGTEKFTYDRWDSFPGIMEKMSGTSNIGESLKGIRV